MLIPSLDQEGARLKQQTSQVVRYSQLTTLTLATDVCTPLHSQQHNSVHRQAATQPLTAWCLCALSLIFLETVWKAQFHADFHCSFLAL